ncbi:MAG: hypothetical protein M0R17_05645 [Candidatus Omnitrophica bacterium]|jgi:hypothetical protein|nr:hypothetical protein [Candidatus Omnitrophota bacterium]
MTIKEIIVITFIGIVIYLFGILTGRILERKDVNLILEQKIKQIENEKK